MREGRTRLSAAEIKRQRDYRAEAVRPPVGAESVKPKSGGTKTFELRGVELEEGDLSDSSEKAA
ncbi:MAG: hypothetical protein KBC69_02105 [Candidatus Magasanikbacteria bacterium]|nr:hypothetical protein [Candidatus Magasanikbacteria bacterium]